MTAEGGIIKIGRNIYFQPIQPQSVPNGESFFEIHSAGS